MTTLVYRRSHSVPLKIALVGTSSQSPGLSVPYFHTICQSHPAVLDLDAQLATDVSSICRRLLLPFQQEMSTRQIRPALGSFLLSTSYLHQIMPSTKEQDNV